MKTKAASGTTLGDDPKIDMILNVLNVRTIFVWLNVERRSSIHDVLVIHKIKTLSEDERDIHRRHVVEIEAV